MAERLQNITTFVQRTSIRRRVYQSKTAFYRKNSQSGEYCVWRERERQTDRNLFFQWKYPSHSFKRHVFAFWKMNKMLVVQFEFSFDPKLSAESWKRFPFKHEQTKSNKLLNWPNHSPELIMREDLWVTRRGLQTTDVLIIWQIWREFQRQQRLESVFSFQLCCQAEKLQGDSCFALLWL